MKCKLWQAFCVVLPVFSGCTTVNVDMQGQVREALTEFEVALYVDTLAIPAVEVPMAFETPPSLFELVANLEADSSGCSSVGFMKGDKKQAIRVMLKRAASVGANGILLDELEVIECSPAHTKTERDEETGEICDVFVSATYRMSAKGRAIYVDETDPAIWDERSVPGKSLP